MKKETVDEIVGRALRGEPYVPTGDEDVLVSAQPAAPQGVAYAELPEPIWRTAQGVAFSERQLYDFADRTHALRASNGQAPAGAWIERWYGSGGKDGYEGWSIVNKDGRCLVAYLGRNVESGAVTEIVMAHNATLASPAAQAAPAAGAVAGMPPGISALMCVISSLRDTAHFSDEEGELTDELRTLRDWAMTQAAAPTPAAQADSVLEDADPIRALIAQHAAILDQNESAYFELCYHRATGWMAWITDKPLCMPPVVNPDRKVLAHGQGDTAYEACRDAARKQGGAT